MIISHKRRYTFVELPRTGSTAIRRELRELYDGTPILHKHATYAEFRRQASQDERTYFVFSGIRNPLDDAVSRYFKLKTDHKHRFSDPSLRQRRRRPLNGALDRRMFNYLRRADATFSNFFLHFYHLPYDTWASLSHDTFDHLIRFERIGEDFDAALRKIGIAAARPLQAMNRTGQQSRDFAEYDSPKAIQRVPRAMGPYRARWGYEFRPSRKVKPPTSLDWMGYRVFSAVAQLYCRELRPRT